MPVFPYTALSDAPAEGCELTVEYPDEIVESRSGIEQVRSLAVLPRHSVSIRWDRDLNTSARIDTLYTFYCLMRGRSSHFTYFDFDPIRTWTAVHVGLGDGATKTFSLQSKDATGVTMYVAGSSAPGVFTASAGTDGADRFVFTNAPALGATITETFTGRRRVTMRFADPNLSYSTFAARLYTIGIGLKERKGV